MNLFILFTFFLVVPKFILYCFLVSNYTTYLEQQCSAVFPNSVCLISIWIARIPRVTSNKEYHGKNC